MKKFIVFAVLGLMLTGCGNNEIEVNEDQHSNDSVEVIDVKIVEENIETMDDVLTVENIYDLSFPDEEKGIVQCYVDLKNNSDKDIKWFSVVIMTFDEDGYPVVSETSHKNKTENPDEYGAYLIVCSSKTIKQQELLTKEAWWFTGKDVKSIKVVVKEVEFHDGTSWTNDDLNDILEENNVIYKVK